MWQSTNDKFKTVNFNYINFINEKRNDPKFSGVIADYENNIGPIKDRIEDEPWFIRYGIKYLDLYRDFKVPDGLRSEFDWKLLFVLTCSSLSQDVKFITPNKVILNDLEDLDIQIKVESETQTAIKLISELNYSQIEKLYDIYIHEQMSLAILDYSEKEIAPELNGYRERRYQTFKLKGIQKKSIETFITERKGLIYHYTSFDTIYQIISGKCIWASDIRYLNDKKELNIGLDIFQQVVQNLENAEDYSSFKTHLLNLADKIQQLASNSIFNASFSGQGDLLSQWRAYGDNGKGVCIGINKDKFIEMLDKEVDSDLYYGLDLDYSMSNCYEEMHDLIALYIVQSSIPTNTERSHDQIKKEFEWFEHIINQIWIIILSAKDNSFFEEKEWRMLYIQNKLKQRKKIEFFPKNERLVPFVRIDLKNIPIEVIRLGPCLPNLDVNKASIEDFLKEHGIHAEVEISKIPYRI